MRSLGRSLLLLALAAAATSAAPAAAAEPRARGSVEQVHVTGAAPGASVSLRGPKGNRTTQRASSLGGVVFRDVTPGPGYRVRIGAQPPSSRVTVLPRRSAPPSTAGYRQSIPSAGYGYLTTRDGTRLAINVQRPAGVSGPVPTLVEYSGYGYADPDGGESSIAQIANLLGYAVVGVNIRGTGCSGGAFDYFEPLQGLDGYDVIETVARQPWVAHGHVGMMGISYGGISQLFVAATRPPHLAAITPLSVLDDSAATLYPGALLNTGFALPWSKDRVEDARPATATTGQPWASKRILGGDETCRANQELHPEAVNLVEKSRVRRFYVPEIADPLAPATFVDRIRTPVFLACQWTDEQTGGRCPALAQRFTGTDRKWFTFTNGTHIDALAPATFLRWYDFLELYVAKRAPDLSDAAKAIAPTLYATAMGVPDVTLPDDPLQGKASYAEAKAAFEALPPVRVLFDNGAGSPAPGAPFAAYERSFASFPPPGTRARTWFLGARGGLTDAPPAGVTSGDRFTYDPAARPATSFSGDPGSARDGLWTATPPYAWSRSPDGTAVSYLTAPLAADTTVLGAGALTLWLRASRPDVDLQATVSEVRPDGKETYVQSGWLRASRRKLDAAKSTLLAPVLSLRKVDAAPLPANRFSELTIPLYYQGHAYRAGSRLRISVSAPGGDQPVWAFAQSPRRTVSVAIARDARRPSRLVLPVLPGLDAPTGLPPCPGLRGEPCRAYVASPNAGWAFGAVTG